MRSVLGRYVLEFAVFICGAVVMIYEIVGSRIVAPYIGTSTYVWTSLIGVILGALSLGYWIGGRTADKHPDARILSAVIFAAAGLISLTILVKEVVLAFIAAVPTGLEIRSLLASLFLFAPASIALGFVTPYAVKLKTTSLAETGNTVGRLYALSTIGSIGGTFAAGFFLIPFVGSTRTLYILAASLILTSLVLAPFAFTRASFATIILFVFGVIASEAGTAYLRSTQEIYDIDTEYNRVRVVRATDLKTGRRMRALATDPFSIQSAMYLDGGELALRYTHFYHLLRHFRPGFRKALMIGGAAYTFPRDYLRVYPEAEIDVVEIDPGITEIARKHFGLTDEKRMSIFHEDGRTFLNRAPEGSYDAVLMDAFGSLFSVPYHLTTVEAVRAISRIVDADGIVIFNLGSAIRGSSSRFLQAELATYRAVFADVLVFKVNTEHPDERVQNLIIVACKTKCTDNPGYDDEVVELLSHKYSDEIPTGELSLTDELAPVEYFNSFGQNLYRR